jgi:hypothetical protein
MKSAKEMCPGGNPGINEAVGFPLPAILIRVKQKASHRCRRLSNLPHARLCLGE